MEVTSEHRAADHAVIAALCSEGSAVQTSKLPAGTVWLKNQYLDLVPGMPGFFVYGYPGCLAVQIQTEMAKRQLYLGDFFSSKRHKEYQGI